MKYGCTCHILLLGPICRKMMVHNVISGLRHCTQHAHVTLRKMLFASDNRTLPKNSKSAKECETSYLSKQLMMNDDKLKMVGATILSPYPTGIAKKFIGGLCGNE